MRANAPQLPGGGMGAAGIDWCIRQSKHIRQGYLALQQLIPEILHNINLLNIVKSHYEIYYCAILSQVTQVSVRDSTTIDQKQFQGVIVLNKLLIICKRC